MKPSSNAPARRPKPTTDDLWADLRALIQSASRVKIRPTRRKGDSPAKRLRALQRALASEDLGAVRELLPVLPGDAANKAQRVVIHAYAAILEVNSAGLSILFDRYNRRELRQVSSALAAIGADRTLGDFSQLERALARAVARGRSRLQAAEWLATKPETVRVDRKSGRHVSEMEKKLLPYCKAHVDQLAAG